MSEMFAWSGSVILNLLLFTIQFDNNSKICRKQNNFFRLATGGKLSDKNRNTVLCAGWSTVFEHLKAFCAQNKT